MTECRVVDSHAHYWQWPAGETAEREARLAAASAQAAYEHGPVSYDDLLTLMDDAGVDSLVQVTRTAMGDDNSYSLEGAREHPERVRVLCRVDPLARDLADRLDAAAADALVVGIRVHYLPPHARWLADGSLHALWRGLESRRLPASVYAPDRLDTLADTARRHPGLSLIVDHAACDVSPHADPAKRFAGWEVLPRLAGLPNVTVKVSGLPEATDERYPFPRATERLKQLCELFPPSRLMWGSNYPPSQRVAEYAESLAFIRDAGFLTAGEKADILGGTAARTLGLPA